MIDLCIIHALMIRFLSIFSFFAKAYSLCTSELYPTILWNTKNADPNTTPVKANPFKGVDLNQALPFYLPATRTDTTGTATRVYKIALNLALACIILNFSWL